MSFVTQAKALFKKDTEKERAGLKASAGKLKEKFQQLKQEVAYRKSPEYVEQRIAEEKRKLELGERKQYLAELKRQNSPLNSVRNYLASVKAQSPQKQKTYTKKKIVRQEQAPRNAGFMKAERNIIYDQQNRNIFYDQEPTNRDKPRGILKL
jgi:anion-transporting  ArsA/GET3 family ATPase